LGFTSTEIATLDAGAEPGILWLVADHLEPVRLAGLPLQDRISTTLWSDQGRTATVVVGGVLRKLSIWSLQNLHEVIAHPADRACTLAAGGLEQDAWPPYAQDVDFRETCPQPVTPPSSPTPSLEGSWHVHGTHLKINADLTGTQTWNAGPCQSGLDARASLCAGQANISFAAAPGGLTGTIQDVIYTDEEGQQVDDTDLQADGAQPGDRLMIRWIDLDVLEVTRDPPIPGGNIHYCGPLATEFWRHHCNV
jgi:hypothetical protein